MPDLPRIGALARLRCNVWRVLCVASLLGFATHALAQAVPANLRACAAETDPTRRLACYDKEMARATGPRPGPKVAPRPAAPVRTATSTGASVASGPEPPTPAYAAEAGGPAGAAQPSRATAKPAVGKGPWRLTARVAGLERWPDAMVLRLDNGQVWQQTGQASGDLSLRIGDTVTIERHLGSYWLSSRYVSDMRVRRKP